MSHRVPVATVTDHGMVRIISGEEAEATARRGSANGYPALDANSRVTQDPANVALLAVAGLTPAADRGIFFVNGTTAALMVVTGYARTLLDDVDAATALGTLGAQPLNANLTALGGLSTADSNFIVGNGSAWTVESGATVRTSLGLGTGDSPAFNNVVVTGTPTAGNHVARLSDIAGIGVKQSVRIGTTAALPACTPAGSGAGKTLTGNVNGALSVDSIAVVVADRVLIKNQVAGADNGIYVVTATGGAGAPFVLTRAGDFDTATEVVPNSTLWIAEGTVNADTQWTLFTNATITVDTTALAFTQTSGIGQLTDGNGLTKTGNTLDVNVDNVTIELNADSLRVKALGITDAHITSITTRSKLPAALAYEDENNIWTGTQDLQGAITTHAIRRTVTVVSTTPYTVLATDHVILCASGAGTVNLPSATGSGREVVVKRVGASNITPDGAGSDTIDGAATITLTLQYQSVTLVDGAAGAWSIL